MLNFIKLFLLQLSHGKKLVIFRIENFGQLDIILPDMNILIDEEYQVVVLTRDPEKINFINNVFKSFFFIFIFRCHLYVSISQNMRVPILLPTSKIFLLPYGYFAKGITLIRYRKKKYRNVFIYNEAMRSYLFDYDSKINTFFIKFPKTRNISNIKIKKSILIAPSYDEYTGLDFDAINQIINHPELQEYSFSLKAHPRYFNKYDKNYSDAIDQLDKKIFVITNFTSKYSLSNFETVITDYSSISYEAINLNLKVLIYWSPKFIEIGLKKLGVKSKFSYLRDPRINSGFSVLPKIRNASQIQTALKNYSRITSNTKFNKFKQFIDNSNASILSIYDFIVSR